MSLKLLGSYTLPFTFVSYFSTYHPPINSTSLEQGKSLPQ